MKLEQFLKKMIKKTALFCCAFLLHITLHSSEEYSPKLQPSEGSPTNKKLSNNTASSIFFAPKDITVVIDESNNKLNIFDQKNTLLASLAINTFMQSCSPQLIDNEPFDVTVVNHLLILHNGAKCTFIYNNYIPYQRFPYLTCKGWETCSDSKYFITSFSAMANEILTTDGTNYYKLWTLGLPGGNPSLISKEPQDIHPINGKSHLDQSIWIRSTENTPWPDIPSEQTDSARHWRENISQ